MRVRDQPIGIGKKFTPLALAVLRSTGEKRRSKYRENFFKKLTDSAGHPFDVCQGVVEVQSDRGSRAVRKAQLRLRE
jgi:hypothetical protein